MAGVAVAAALTDDQWRWTRLQLHTGETFAQATRNDQHVIGAVLADGNTLVIADVPATLVGLHRLAAVQRRTQSMRHYALGLGRCNEGIDDLLCLERLASLLSRRQLGAPGGVLGP